MYKKSLLFLTVLIMLSVTFGTADAYLDSETGRFITQDPYLGEITRPPSVHRYNHVKSNPASFVDRNGYDYVEVRDNKAYWIIEKDIAGPFNPDTRRVYIGNTKENDPRNIYLTTESGGGMVDRKALKYAASKFWDRYDADEFSSVLNPADISSLSHLPEVQDQIITDHIGRLDPHQIGGIYADRPVFRSKLTNRLDKLQTAGDIAGAIPGAGIFADVPNTALYGLRGKWTDFGIGLAAAIPVFGQGAIAAKYGKKGGKFIDEGMEFASKTATRIPGRIQSRINLRVGDGSKSSGLKYALNKHGGTGPVNKSQFSISQGELKNLLQSKQVVDSKVSISPTSGEYMRIVDLDRTIGHYPVKSGGSATSHITVITDKAGNLINTFPGKPVF